MQLILLMIFLFVSMAKSQSTAHLKRLDSSCRSALDRSGYCEFDNHFEHLRPSQRPGLLVCASHQQFHEVFDSEPDRLLPDDDCGIPNVSMDQINSGPLGAKDFPFLVRLNHDNVAKSNRCMGVLVSSSHIITSVTCAKPDTLKSIELKLCRPTEYCKEDAYSEIRLFNGYVNSSYRLNFAIIELQIEVVQYSRLIRPICLPFAERFRFIPVGRHLAVGHDEKIIRVQSHRNSENACGSYRNINPGDICASGVDSCKINSGTPLMYVEDRIKGHPKVYLLGIASNGPMRCANSQNQAIYYGDVFSHSPWIAQNLRFSQPNANTAPVSEQDQLLDDDDRCGVPNADINQINSGSLGVNDFPFLVRLNHDNVTKSNRCMGVLISSGYIITSMTCAHPQTLKSIEVKRCQPGYCKEADYSEIRFHNGFRNSLGNNFAIIKLQDEVDRYSNLIRPICLPFEGRFRSIPNGRLYAITDDERIISVQSRKGSENACRVYEGMNPADMCAGGVDSCKIKSGTPLMYIDDSDREHPKVYLLGIASNGPLDCRTSRSQPIYYGDVFSHGEWIAQNIKLIRSNTNAALISEPRRPRDNRCGVPNVGLDQINSGSLGVNDFPFLVRLNHDNVAKSNRCMGVLISSRHILTSITCAKPQTLQSIELKLCRPTEKCKEDAYSEIRLSNGFTNSYKNNVAIIKLENEVSQYSSLIRPICLPFEERFRSIPNGLLYAITHDDGIIRVQSHKGSQTVCRVYRNMDPADMCAGGVDSCKINDGTPLMYVDQSDREYQKVYLLGIASNGPLDCRTFRNQLIYYGDVFSHKDWISQNLQ